jgi:hypothetical protein
VFLFFRRSRDAGGAWQTQIAPLLALAGLLGAAFLAVSNFSLLAGGSGLLSVLLIAVVPATALFGLAVAMIMRARRPQMYQEVGADMA